MVTYQPSIRPAWAKVRSCLKARARTHTHHTTHIPHTHITHLHYPTHTQHTHTIHTYIHTPPHTLYTHQIHILHTHTKDTHTHTTLHTYPHTPLIHTTHTPQTRTHHTTTYYTHITHTHTLPTQTICPNSHTPHIHTHTHTHTTYPPHIPYNMAHTRNSSCQDMEPITAKVHQMLVT